MNMPDLTTTYLGLQLKNPLVASASPLSKRVDIVRRLEDAGVAAIVMYSLFEEQITHESHELDHYLERGTYSYAESLSYFPDLDLSTSHELRLPLRWIAIRYGRIAADFALTSGVHTAYDVLKAMMAGASVAMMASELLAHGLGRLGQILADIEGWMEENEYESIAQMKGCMSQRAVAEPAAFERANYMKALNSFDYYLP